MPTSPARGALYRLTDEALATDKCRYNHFELARLNKWHRPVSGSPAIPGSGSGYGNGVARGVKNLRKRFRKTPK
ncbi:jg5863 [Pararge aegeria aegeria]|uniref:Jg5863 protein n=1 Tax=Pararge aegeria aegeria TaxID=348720 RepID=A0A8S4SBW6_9NEOP|nr:jg5863 [Pararge aegeria aegeria]